MSKYNARKAVVDGITFASQKEARRYAELKLMERAGEITRLVLQPKFLLQDSFKDKTGKTHRAIYYVGDFEYVTDLKKLLAQQTHVCEDVKGVKTAVYKLKRKMFLKLYPHIEHREV